MNLERTLTFAQMIEWRIHWLNCRMDFEIQAKLCNIRHKDDVIALVAQLEKVMQDYKRILHETGIMYVDKTSWDVEENIKGIPANIRFNEFYSELKRLLISFYANYLKAESQSLAARI